MKMNEVRNQMTERVLDLTVEMMFLLTGEDYIVLKRPGEPERPGGRPLVLEKSCVILSPHSLERERNSEEQILELTHRILRLLTGEVPAHEAVTVPLPEKQRDSVDEIQNVIKNIMCEDHQPLRSMAKRLNEEKLETGDETEHPDVNDPPYERVTNREAESTVPYGELPESDASNPTDHPQTEYPSASINEEATSRDSDTDIYLLTEHTQTKPTSPTRIKDAAMPNAKSNVTDSDICAPSKRAEADYPVSDGKEDPNSYEEGNLSDEEMHTGTKQTVPSVSVKEESASRGQGQLPDTDVCTPADDTDTEYPPAGIKEESISCKGEDLSDTDIYPPTHVKEESASCDGGDLSDVDIYPPAEHTPTEYPPVFLKKETASFDGGNLTHPEICTAMEDTGIEYSCIDIKEESASCDEGDFSDTDIYPFAQAGYPSPHIKEEPASCEEGNDADTDIGYQSVYIKEESESSDEEFFTDNDAYTRTGSADKRHLAHASPSVIAFTCNPGTVEQTSILTGEKQFSCSECGKFFTTKSNLLAHHRVHTGEKKFSCSECGKYFTAKSSLSAHQRIHTGEKRFCCPVCGKRFTASSCLIAHKRIHTGEKPYACSICGRCFTTNSSLFTHQRTHTGEKPFSCSACGKCFTTNSGLVTHRRSHTGEKPFSCSECGKRFSKTSNLISHKRLHTGEKPFSCLECGKSFISKAYLIIHEKIHMQDKPFSCTICGRCFSQKSSVYRHQRTHANEKSDNPNEET